MKKIVKCENGHKYDKKKHSTCPYCGVDVDLDIIKNFNKSQNITLRKENKVSELNHAKVDHKKTQLSVEQKTVLSSQGESTKKDTTPLYLKGWLVGISGHVRNRDYRFNNKDIEFGIDFNGAFNSNIGNTMLALTYFKLYWDNKALIIRNMSQERIFINTDLLDDEVRLLEGDRIIIHENDLLVQFFKGGRYLWE